MEMRGKGQEAETIESFTSLHSMEKMAEQNELVSLEMVVI